LKVRLFAGAVIAIMIGALLSLMFAYPLQPASEQRLATEVAPIADDEATAIIPAIADDVKALLGDQEQALLSAESQTDAGRFLTVLIPYDRSRFFVHKGEPRGFEYELVRQFEERFNEAARGTEPPLETIFLPVPFAQLLDLLAEGTGDIAAGGLTVTTERAERVRFSEPYMTEIREVVVANTGVELGNTVETLAGRRIVVVNGSSYAEHLRALSDRFVASGLPAVEIVEAPVSVMSEDLVELVHAGAVALTVVDEHIAELWANELNGLNVTDLAITEGNDIAWALSNRLDNAVVESINEFLIEARTGSLLGNILFKRYFEDSKWIENPLGPEAITEVSRYRPLFSKHAEANNLDWRLVAAVAFQESGFDPFATSAAGARGLMQVRPATAAEVGVGDLNSPDAQVAAGTRYLASLRDRFLSEGVEPRQAVNLALAGYNAGPARLERLRQVTKDELGLDPDVWFFNVERAAAQDVGLETVRYVANVNKYRLAYELGETVLTARAVDRERLNHAASPTD